MSNQWVRLLLRRLGASKEESELGETIITELADDFFSSPQQSKGKKRRREPITNKLKHEVWRRDNFTCQYCGRTINEVELEVDHIFSVVKGGTTTIDNLQTLCQECNRRKGGK